MEKLGIIEKIDKNLKLNKNKDSLVTFGQRVAAMVLNGLGFITRLWPLPSILQRLFF